MEKINIAELLKDCPQGMELDCTMWNNVVFERVDPGNYPIRIRIKDDEDCIAELTEFGEWNYTKNSKCVIFPKGKNTWEGFVPPCKFKDGDVCCVKTNGFEHIFIFKVSEDYDYIRKYVNLSENTFYTNEYAVCTTDCVKEIRLATEEEKQKLFQAIKDNGYKWNAETKTLEKLPKFKVGDIVQYITDSTDRRKIEEIDTLCNMYHTDSFPIMFEIEDDWGLIPDKFDISTLEPFAKVLVRDSDKDMWCASIFSHTWKDKYFCVGAWHNQCIPYEANKELRGTTNDCDEYYKTWEK